MPSLTSWQALKEFDTHTASTAVTGPLLATSTGGRLDPAAFWQWFSSGTRAGRVRRWFGRLGAVGDVSSRRGVGNLKHIGYIG